ncbi:MAG: bifunctional YncE family protein/alkaline phosphatase family protein [Verrucomicrobiota bacterium]
MKTVGTLLCAFLFALSVQPARAEASARFAATTAAVGRSGTNQFVTPVNQRLSPAGKFIELPGMRPQAIALSPDGRLLLTAGMTHELLVLDPATGNILQHVPLPSGKLLEATPVSAEILNPDSKAQVSYTGLVFSPDGSRVYLANVGGDLKVFGVDRDHKISALFSIPLPPANAPRRKDEIPAGLAVSPDGKRLYAALNLSNRAAEIDAATGKILRLWDVGTAPFGVAVAGKKLYVSNWGGRRPDAASPTGPAGRGTLVRTDDRGIASEGTVSVIDLATNSDSAFLEIPTGRHASALAVSPNQRWLVVANSAEDTVSIIDTRSDKIVETLCMRQNPGDLFGAQPNALAFDASGRKLYVCNGTQNAVAVVRFNPGQSELLGLIPVGWFPGAVAVDAKRGQLCVANIKGLTPGQFRKGGSQLEFNTKLYHGSLSLVDIPSTRELARHTRTALANLRYPLLAEAKLPARAGQPARPVPERVGEPSVFKHVIYIIKENRTYDQVLGDVREGNGDPSLCTFGEKFTPNQHRFVRDFVLLDNTYCSGILSADGHNWADTGIATEYVERSFASWPRSYPSGGGENDKDALAYSPAGFIWNNALAHSKTIRVFGEYCTGSKSWKDKTRKGAPTYLDCYRDFTNGLKDIEYHAEPDVEPLRPHIATRWPAWDLDVPDQVRAALFIEYLQQCEADGTLPEFIVFWLTNDHTSGTKAGAATPAAQVADNDLAFGKVVEALSRSRFWKDTCVFGIEDDPQAGWDHVSGYRTTAYVISPYTKRGEVVSTQYNQTSLLRTMELILGLPPMNQMDATATPMFDCFTNVPDFQPFTALPSNVALDSVNPEPKKVSDHQLRKDAQISAHLRLKEADQCPEDVLNRILWRAMKGSQAPYPEWAVKFVDED